MMFFKINLIIFQALWLHIYTPNWGFFAHRLINRMAVYSLPTEMFGFYKKNLDYIESNAVNPDQRRYAVVDEAPRHFIDLDHYVDSIRVKLPKLYFSEAVKVISEDTLKAHGIVPWHIQKMVYSLTEAFAKKDQKSILRLSADLGHYVGDAHVPLHTTSNYNGQLSNQLGIHGFWESRLPELFWEDYDLWVGKASYENNVARRSWQAVLGAHAALDSVFNYESALTQSMGEDKKFTIDERLGVTSRMYSRKFSKQYHDKLSNQVNRQMKASVKTVADLWFTAWVNAGQPDLSNLEKYNPSPEDIENEKKNWLKTLLNIRKESDN